MLDEKLGDTFTQINKFIYKNDYNSYYGRDKIYTKTMYLEELISLVSKNQDLKNKFIYLINHSNFQKGTDGKIVIPNETIFVLNTYIDHSKIYCILKLMMECFDLEYIYENLCSFFDLPYSNYNTTKIQQCSELHFKFGKINFNEKENRLNIDEKKLLIKNIFSKISIAKFCEIKFELYEQEAQILSEIAQKNSQILNDESFNTIMGYIKESLNNKVKYKK